MPKILILLSCVGLVLTGCQSHKLPQAKGKWTPVNAVDFIPPNVTKYSDNVKTLAQDVDLSEADKEIYDEHF